MPSPHLFSHSERTRDIVLWNNRKAIESAIKKLEVVNYETVSALIPHLLETGKLHLDLSCYQPVDRSQPTGLGRYLLYDHKGDKPFSIWVFAIGKQQKTSIHDHKYRGTVTVLSEAVTEKYYKPTSQNTARRVDQERRNQFHTNREELEIEGGEDNKKVHQLKRTKALGEGVSVTLHIYEMPAHRMSTAGTLEDNRNLDTIYTKDKNPPRPKSGL